ncbi:MAG: GNAT family N-acetyltransferase [Dehalococcoidia bacterium]|nr:GNAT family N-acetyltransferase [Dehalococcoidia bacterium]
MESDRLIALSARNFADWHEASLNALGVRCKTDAALWRQLGTGGSPVYVSAITLNPLIDPVSQIRQIEQIEALRAGLPHAIIDSWARLDLSGLGYRRSAPQPWYIREPGPMREKRLPDGFIVEEVRDEAALAEFEVASWNGFESGDAVRAVGTGGQHHPDTLNDPRMRYFVGRLNGRVVAGSIAYIGDDITGVFGVSTLPEYRRRGFGQAVSRAATLVAPDTLAHLEPSEQAARMYRIMGYRQVGVHTHWFHPGTITQRN